MDEKALEQALDRIERNGGKLHRGGKDNNVIVCARPGLKVLGAIDFACRHGWEWQREE